MASWSFPGHCSSCGQWLGVENVALADEGEAADSNCARSPAELVATLLVRSSKMERSLSGEALRINLRTCLNDLAEGNESLLGRAVEIHQKTVESWLAGRTLPALSSLLKICCRLELPLLRFLTEPMASGDSDWEHARRVRALLSESKLRGTHLIVREVKKVVDQFSERTFRVAAHKPSG